MERPYGPINIPAAKYPRTGLPEIPDQKKQKCTENAQDAQKIRLLIKAVDWLLFILPNFAKTNCTGRINREDTGRIARSGTIRKTRVLRIVIAFNPTCALLNENVIATKLYMLTIFCCDYYFTN